MLFVLFLTEGLTAFCVLAYEVSVARLVAPHAGMSTDTWTAIIAAFLLALAVGHRIGGALATGAEIARMLRHAALASGGAGLAMAATPLLMPAWDGLVLAAAPLEPWRIVLFSALPCIPAGLLLGIVTPPLMTVAILVSRGRGPVVGAMVAAGAAGSVAGVLVVQWLLLDTLGTRATVLAVSLLAMANAALIAAPMIVLRGADGARRAASGTPVR